MEPIDPHHVLSILKGLHISTRRLPEAVGDSFGSLWASIAAIVPLPACRLSQPKDKEYLPLKGIKKRIEGGAFTAGDWAGIFRGSSMTQSNNLPEPAEDTYLTPQPTP